MSDQAHERFFIEQVLRVLCQPDGASRDELSQKDGMTGAFVHFMDEMPGGFLIYRASQGEEIIYANRSLLRIFQCETMEEFRAHTGNSFRGLVHPDDLKAVEESIRSQVEASQHDFDYVEYRVRRRDGAIRWIEDYGHFVQTESEGGIFYVFLGDATEKRESLMEEKTRLMNERLERERKLRHLIEEYDKERTLINEEYLRQLEVIEGLSVNYEAICYVDLDRDQVIPYRLSVRTAALFYNKLTDRAYSSYATGYVDMWVHPEDRELVTKATSPEYLKEKLEDCLTFYINYRVLVSGELQYIQLRVVNVSHEEGVCQVVMGYRRVDEEIQQQMEQQSLLAEALAKANLAINSKNTFLSNMSHDMRTPLHAIFGFTSLAKLNLENTAEAADYLDRVETASRQLLDMIDKVLEVSSLDGETAELEETECDLRQTVGDVYSFLEPQAQEKDISFTLNCDSLRHNIVFTDQEKLRQLVMYLANNALTYTNPGGRVSIRVEEGEELSAEYAVYRITVEDTGIGISSEFLDKLFEPFSREKNTTLGGVHGIGLGLTIAKNIVDMMGGVLSVQSAIDKGSTFTAAFRFRVQEWHASARKQAEEGAAFRILLVEDNEINREIEMELLGELGFEIDPAENGMIALEKMRDSDPGYYDVVLMDLQMPVMDGWQASVAIRALPDKAKARVPIIALSANALERDLRKSRECGLDAHLRKPMDLALLLRTMEELTGRAWGPGEI
jgi:PAS domain S-box-containing protein